MRNQMLCFHLALLLAAAAPESARAEVSASQTEVTNNVSMGDISISLQEYELDVNGREIPYQNDKQILPGQTIDKIVRISNKANEAWIRAKLEYDTLADGFCGMDDSMVTLSDSFWIRRGDYYYCTVPVERGDSVDFIDKVRIPPEWDGNYAGKSFQVIVTAEAVQTDNFKPDFSSSDPWFGTLIETCVHTGYEHKAESMDNFSIVFEGGAEGMVRVGDDFFHNFGSLMPGDTLSDHVQIKNNYNRNVRIYFRTETVADDELLNALELEIKNGDDVIYSGTLDGEVEEDIELACLSNGMEGMLTYNLYVPEWLDNSYALAKTKTKWIFTAVLSTGSIQVGSLNQGWSVDEYGNRILNYGWEEGGEPWERDLAMDASYGKTLAEIIKESLPKAKMLPQLIRNLITQMPKMGDGWSAWPLLAAMAVSGAGIFLFYRKRKEDGNRDIQD